MISAASFFLVAGYAQAQEATPAPAADSPTEVIVTGVRASMRSAQNIKRNSSQIVDSIVAEDIGKFPDVNVADSLQRITGIQIGRDLGEGGTVAIRGLTQIETTVNGREIFTAGTSRTLDFKDVPAELLAGIDVYKSPTANLIEGGIGGSIDVRTRRPFDFKGFELSGSARATYADLTDRVSPQYSLLVSNRWHTGIGEIGVLLNAAYQQRYFRNDLVATNGELVRADLITGRDLSLPNGFSNNLQTGYRTRIGLNGIVQWKPTEELMLYAGYDYQDFPSQQYFNQTLFIPGRPATGATGTADFTSADTVETFDGTDDVSKITYRNARVRVSGASRRLTHNIKQTTFGAAWASGKWKVNLDGDYTKSFYDLQFRDTQIAIVVPSLTQDLTYDVPAVITAGIDLTNPANYTRLNETYSVNRYDGEMKAIRGDVSYETDNAIVHSLHVGFRYADRDAFFAPIRDTNSLSGPLSLNPGLYKRVPFTDFFNQTDANSPQIRDFIVPDAYQVSDIAALRTQLGITTPIPAVNPLSTFDINEKTSAWYAMAKYGFNLGVPIDGNLGLRFLNTQDTLVGNQAVYTGNVQTGTVPVNIHNEYGDVLPSFNLRAKLTDILYLRLAASKALTRPNFDQLTPSVNLIPSLQFGGAGNPYLKPLRADMFDASLEYYFNPTGSLSLAAFHKDVDGFIVTTGFSEVYSGLTYTINRPSNGGKGTIEGFELGYQQFFDFLPGPLSGLGLQTNYTRVNSSAPNTVPGFTITLPGLSKDSYNIVAMYEKYGVSARLAYNWRSEFFESLFSGNGATNVPVMRDAYGWLDASMSYDVNPRLTLTLDATNLLHTRRDSYYQLVTRPNDRSLDDQQISLGLRYHW
jgi:TonB-dependent receptor